MIRSHALLVFFVASNAALCTCARGADTARPPNIILIMADDLGYGDLGCYGQQLIETPHLDNMAAEGLRFTDFYSGSTVCAPSRCVLMTGLHTGHCFIRGNARQNLRPEDVTIAEILHDAGYATGLCGKWGIGHEGSTGVPTQQGFDFFYGYLNQRHAHNYYPSFLIRNEERVLLRNVVPDEGDFGQGVATEKVDYSHDLITAEALNFIDENHEEPFFLYIAWTIPHANNEAGGRGMEVPDYGIYTDRDWPEPQKGLAAMITKMDTDFGRIIDLLDRHDIADNTLVIFTSDNGPHREGGNNPDFADSNGPLRGIKRSLTEGGIRVPMIALWPGQITAGTTTDFAGCFQDMMPTLVDLAHASDGLPEVIDGISFVPTLTGGEQPQHGYLYWAFYEGGSGRALRKDDWKIIQQPMRSEPRLYNLAEDLGEEDDLASEHPEIVAR